MWALGVVLVISYVPISRVNSLLLGDDLGSSQFLRCQLLGGHKLKFGLTWELTGVLLLGPLGAPPGNT